MRDNFVEVEQAQYWEICAWISRYMHEDGPHKGELITPADKSVLRNKDNVTIAIRTWSYANTKSLEGTEYYIREKEYNSWARFQEIVERWEEQ